MAYDLVKTRLSESQAERKHSEDMRTCIVIGLFSRADLGGELRGPQLPPLSHVFILKTIATSHLASSTVQSGLCCSYGVRMCCRRNFLSPLFLIFLDPPLVLSLLLATLTI